RCRATERSEPDGHAGLDLERVDAARVGPVVVVELDVHLEERELEGGEAGAEDDVDAERVAHVAVEGDAGGQASIERDDGGADAHAAADLALVAGVVQDVPVGHVDVDEGDAEAAADLDGGAEVVVEAVAV